MKLIDQRTGQTLALKVKVARTAVSRGVGLLGRKNLPVGEGLVLLPCKSVHTWFMRFSIDVAFLDEHHRIVKAYHNLKPFRMTKFISSAKMVVELPAGTLQSAGVEEGHEIGFYENQFRLSNP